MGKYCFSYPKKLAHTDDSGSRGTHPLWWNADPYPHPIRQFERLAHGKVRRDMHSARAHAKNDPLAPPGENEDRSPLDQAAANRRTGMRPISLGGFSHMPTCRPPAKPPDICDGTTARNLRKVSLRSACQRAMSRGGRGEPLPFPPLILETTPTNVSKKVPKTKTFTKTIAPIGVRRALPATHRWHAGANPTPHWKRRTARQGCSPKNAIVGDFGRIAFPAGGFNGPPAASMARADAGRSAGCEPHLGAAAKEYTIANRRPRCRVTAGGWHRERWRSSQTVMSFQIPSGDRHASGAVRVATRDCSILCVRNSVVDIRRMRRRQGGPPPA